MYDDKHCIFFRFLFNYYLITKRWGTNGIFKSNFSLIASLPSVPLIFKQRVEFKPFQAPGAVSPPSPPSPIPHHWPCFQIHPGSAPTLFCIAEAWPLNFIFPGDPWPPGFSLGWPTGAQVAGKVSPWHQFSPGSLRTATSLRVLLALGVLISSPSSAWLFLSANDFDKCPRSYPPVK